VHVRTSLFIPESILEDAPLWRMSRLNSQLSKLFLLAADIAKDVNLDESYGNVASDVSLLLGTHNCSLQAAENNSGASLAPRQYSISRSCILRKEMIELMYTFFANQTTINLALTESIISLACCRMISQDGWFIAISPTGDFADEKPPSIFNIIEGLVQHIRQWRSSFDDWDALLAAQKRKLLDGDDENQGESKLASMPSERIPIEPVSRGRRGRALRSEIFGSMDESFSPSPKSQTRPSPDPIGASPRSSEVDHRFGSASPRGTSSPSAILQRQVVLPQLNLLRAESPTNQHTHLYPKAANTGDDFSSGAMMADEPSHSVTASLSHILTNAVILQEFILEVIAVVQVRASLFGEVDFL
jgi:hypothetical protein